MFQEPQIALEKGLKLFIQVSKTQPITNTVRKRTDLSIKTTKEPN